MLNDWDFFAKNVKKNSKSSRKLIIKVANNPIRALKLAVDLSKTAAT